MKALRSRGRPAGPRPLSKRASRLRRCAFAGWAALAAAAAPGDERSVDALPASPDLPDLFTFDDGSAVTSREDWGRRRGELVEALLHYQYGRMPPAPDSVTAREDRTLEHASGRGTETWLTLRIGSRRALEMRCVVYRPRGEGPFPVMLEEEGSPGGSRIAGRFLEKGYLFIEYARHDLDPDEKGVVGPAQAAYPDYDWATLAVWAWGGMRVVDYLETRDDVDLARIAITGHSRGGKMALLAAALDERFALVAPNGSGAGGAGSSRLLGPGAESVGMNDKPHWYHERLQAFAGREERLPCDQHFLKALVAPRALLCLESSDDLFANPEGTRATTAAARPVFELLGRPEANAICFRRGGHTFSDGDWERLLEFAEWMLRGRPPADPEVFRSEPAVVEPATGSGGEAGWVEVGDPGNPADVDYPRVGPIGAVDEAFSIGRRPVSNREYADFLTAVASASDPHGLHHPRMKIRRWGDEGHWRYAAWPASARAPVTWVGWSDAARYCNWRHGGDTEAGAYLMGRNGFPGERAAGARCFLPTEHEWHKAACYRPASGDYHLFPARDVHRRPPGDAWASRSAYGMESGGPDLWEWTETPVGALFRGLRSDGWFQGNNRQAAGRFYSHPRLEDGRVGFRVAGPAGPVGG